MNIAPWRHHWNFERFRPMRKVRQNWLTSNSAFQMDQFLFRTSWRLGPTVRPPSKKYLKSFLLTPRNIIFKYIFQKYISNILKQTLRAPDQGSNLFNTTQRFSGHRTYRGHKFLVSHKGNVVSVDLGLPSKKSGLDDLTSDIGVVLDNSRCRFLQVHSRSVAAHSAFPSLTVNKRWVENIFLTHWFP